ncbi:MAG: glycosyl transferase [Marinomonas sp.]|nr:glycosyl transferase [Marinomonas sp.]
MLEKYKSDTRIGQISGFNYGFGVPVNDTDYFFSKYGFIWGWATWRRAWNLYDIKMKKFPEITALDTCDLFFGSNKCSQIENFRKVYSNEMDTWDYQWSYSRFINLAYTIVPKDNLIENIGFGDDATHTFGDNPYNDVSRKEVNIADLKHPEYFLQFKDFYAIHEKKSSILRSFFRKVKYAFR